MQSQEGFQLHLGWGSLPLVWGTQAHTSSCLAAGWVSACAVGLYLPFDRSALPTV